MAINPSKPQPPVAAGYNIFLPESEIHRDFVIVAQRRNARRNVDVYFWQPRTSILGPSMIKPTCLLYIGESGLELGA